MIIKDKVYDLTSEFNVGVACPDSETLACKNGLFDVYPVRVGVRKCTTRAHGSVVFSEVVLLAVTAAPGIIYLKFIHAHSMKRFVLV